MFLFFGSGGVGTQITGFFAVHVLKYAYLQRGTPQRESESFSLSLIILTWENNRRINRAQTITLRPVSFWGGLEDKYSKK